jgi:RNA polymerase sigma-70 factor (ECF subfamily)
MSVVSDRRSLASTANDRQSLPIVLRDVSLELNPEKSSGLDALLPPDEMVSLRLIESRQDFLRFFRRRLRQPEDAEDALQDFCIKAIRSASNLDKPEKVDAWLGRILRSTLTDYYRRRAAWARTELAYRREPQIETFDPERDRSGGTCSCVHRAIPTLKPEYAELLSRADLNEEPRERIAEELGLTVNNVGVRLHRARHALKGKLKEICGSCESDGCSDGQCNCGPRLIAGNGPLPSSPSALRAQP